MVLLLINRFSICLLYWYNVIIYTFSYNRDSQYPSSRWQYPTSSSSMSFRSSSASGIFNRGLSLLGNMNSQTVESPRSKLNPWNTKILIKHTLKGTSTDAHKKISRYSNLHNITGKIIIHTIDFKEDFSLEI